MISTKFTILPDPIDKFTESKKQTFTNKSGDFEIEYGKESEVRMGLPACDVKIFKKGKDLTKELLGRHFLATIPNPFAPLSPNGKFAFIPTCPILKDSGLIVINTETLEKKFIAIEDSAYANQFATANDLLLITGYTKVVIYNCETTIPITIFTKGKDQDIDYSYFSSAENKIVLLFSDYEKPKQTIKTFTLNGDLIEESEIKPPSEIFKFDFNKYKQIATTDEFNLFNSSGYSFLAVGKVLNKWIFRNHNVQNNTLNLKTYVPVSEIYFNTTWKTKGCDILMKEVAASIIVD